MTLLNKLTPARIVAWVVLVLMLLVTVFPLVFVVKTSLVPASDLYTTSTDLLPRHATLIHYKKVLGMLSTEESIAAGGSGANFNISQSLINSILFTGIIVIAQTFNCALAAYAFARIPFRGSKVLFGSFVASMMVPGVVTMIPNFILIRDLGLLNSMAGMVAPFFLMHGFTVFFLRQFFLSLPKEIEEAACIDGAGPFVIFFKIALPLSWAPLMTIATLTTINMWNEFLWPFLIGKEASMHTLPVALQSFKSQTPQGQPDWSGLMAATVIATIPTVAMLFFFGRRIVESVQFTGGK
ncbi:carbohydrate ABC transporter permease [Reinekea forsetii]|uniref:N-acetyl-D-glucosamine ABC transport system, permease protein 2 n=1 Tax=Reinekea forsetii TaxID=1336806 RepID=A0A2K8KMA6_9GAMM|nr:carbohydrate ABC transporter permease [Reinekea forsetii]ATX75978.1 N-acetyl-D-glucosamine ABC transport system, permease protein 2 [Reinekea forsetii]